MAETKYFIDGRWQSRGDLVRELSRNFNGGKDDPYIVQWADQVINDYNNGSNAYGMKRDPDTGSIIPFEHTYDADNPPPSPYYSGEDYEAIPMSELEGGGGTDTMMGGPVEDRYLVDTANPGGTMTRLGSENAIMGLHPVFRERLAGAIQQARAEGINASIFSALRPPGLGVGKFGDKFSSMHAYGAAVDIDGIGTPGSRTAHRWYEIAKANGLYNPYGPNHKAEFNHFQFVPDKQASQLMRSTINRRGPINSWDQVWSTIGKDPVELLAEMGYTGEDAVSRFQSEHPEAGKVDGILGPNTTNALIAQLGNGPPSTANRLADLKGSPAYGSQAASLEDVPTSYPSPQELVAMLADRGYTGPDAVMRYQADQMGVAGEGGNITEATMAALMNPREFSPPPRPDRGLRDTLVAQGPGALITSAAREEEGVTEQYPGGAPKSPPLPNMRPGGPGLAPAGLGEDLMALKNRPNPMMPEGDPWAASQKRTPPPGGGLGAIRGAGLAPAQVAGLPTPKSRPVGLGGVGQEAVSDYRRLRLGDQGDDVSRVQQQLAAAGFDPGPFDGLYGPRTAAAVLAFQRSAEESQPGVVGGKLDAIAGPFTQSALFDKTQNSALASLNGGPGAGGPPSVDVAMAGWGAPVPAAAKEFDPGGGTGRDSRPPGTAPATDPIVRTSAAREPSKPFEAKPWSHPFYKDPDRGPWTPDVMKTIEDNKGMTGLTVTPATPENSAPAPLSPINVIGSMGGTGSSGLGPAGPSGPGMGGGSSDSGFGGTDDDDDDNRQSSYNESFAQTGWI